MDAALENRKWSLGLPTVWQPTWPLAPSASPTWSSHVLTESRTFLKVSISFSSCLWSWCDAWSSVLYLARAALEILNQQQTHPSSCLCKSFLPPFMSLMLYPQGPIIFFHQFSPCLLLFFCFLWARTEKNIVWTIPNVQIMYKHLIARKVQKLLLFLFFFYFTCMHSIEQQELK